MDRVDVVVIGLGAFGSATLYALSQRGRRVVGFDRFEPGHDRGSSHGETRLIRLAYFEDPAYVPLVRRAYEGWAALEAQSGESILIRTGIVEAGVADSELVASSIASAVENAIPHAVLTPQAANTRFPAFRIPPDWRCVFQPDAGVLQPEKAIGLFLKGAVEQGALVRNNTQVTSIVPDGDGVRVTLAGGEVVRAAAAVVAAGPWMGDLVPDLRPHLTLTRQVLTWFAPADPRLVTPDRMPAFLFDGGGFVAYGMPDVSGSGVKAAFHDPQGLLDSADDPRPPPAPREIAAIEEVVRALVPAAAGRPTRSTTCIYTRAPDGHFVVGPHPESSRIVIASPCSGHGFKFATVIGEALADLATTGGTSLPIGLFDPLRLLRAT
jgi:sarcosine oxidase